MAVTLQAAADDLAFQDIEGGEQRSRDMALVVVGHGAGTALLHRQSRLGALQSLDLRLLIDAQHLGAGARIAER